MIHLSTLIASLFRVETLSGLGRAIRRLEPQDPVEPPAERPAQPRRWMNG